VASAAHRVIQAVMSLEAGLTGDVTAPARDAFCEFARDVDLTLYLLSAALRGSPIRPGDSPDLREAHNRLVETGDLGVGRYALVNVETDRITNSLNTLSEQILRWQSQEVAAAVLTTPLPR
jgi:hypothetical protein